MDGSEGVALSGAERERNLMKAERWEKVIDLFQSALERAPEERAAFLDETCHDDEGMRREVESLLTSHERAENFIEVPAFEVAPELATNDSADALVVLAPLSEWRQCSRWVSHRETAGYLSRFRTAASRRCRSCCRYHPRGHWLRACRSLLRYSGSIRCSIHYGMTLVFKKCSRGRSRRQSTNRDRAAEFSAEQPSPRRQLAKDSGSYRDRFWESIK